LLWIMEGDEDIFVAAKGREKALIDLGVLTLAR
jgi:hypothetical protein